MTRLEDFETLVEYFDDTKYRQHIRKHLEIVREALMRCEDLLSVSVFGSLAKGTNLKCHSDVDMIAFFNPEYGLEMVKKDVIAILDHHPYEVLMDDYEYKLKLKHHFFCCDLLLLEGNHLSDRLPDDHDIFKPDLRGERELSETNLRGHSMDDPVRKAKKAYLAPKSTSYIIRKMNQSPEYRQLARLSKFWGQITVRDKDFKSKSTVMELLAVYVCDSAGKSLDFLSLRDIFQKFLSLFLDKQTIKIFDADQYEGILSDSDLKALKNMSGPLIVDPGNPFNHLHSSKNVPWDSLARYATDTLNRIDVPGATLSSIFMPLSGDRVLVESLSISKLSLEPLRQPAFVWENTLPLRPKTIFKHEVEEKIENQRVIDSLQAYSCILDIALSTTDQCEQELHFKQGFERAAKNLFVESGRTHAGAKSKETYEFSLRFSASVGTLKATFQVCYSRDSVADQMNGLASKFSDANLGSGSSTTTDISRARTSSTLPLADPKRSLSEEDKTLAIKIHALLLNAKGPVKASVITKKLTDKQRLEKPTVNRVLYAYEDIYFVIDPDPPYWKLVCDF